jgi:hypothetical protein
MIDLLVLLPYAPFEQEDFDRAFNVLKRTFDYKKLYFYCHKNSFEYYKNKYPQIDVEILIDSDERINKLSKEMIATKYDKANEVKKYRFVIWQNSKLEICATADKNDNIVVYRWWYLDNKIWNIRSNTSIEECPTIKDDIFSRIHSSQKGNFGLLPYGYTHRTIGYGHVNELGYRVPNDYHKYANREDNHKLIVFFGGSACNSMCCRYENMFTNVLEDQLKKMYEDQDVKFTVLNFGMPGHLVLDQIISYMLYVEEIKPDIVVSYDMLNDFLCGGVNDEKFIKKFKVNYNFIYEEWAKDLYQSKEKLSWDIFGYFDNKDLTPKDIFDVYYYRKKQFEHMVKSNGSIFVSVYQPLVFSKKELSKDEKRKFDYYTPPGLQRYYPYLEVLYNKFDNYIEDKDDFEYTLNLHKEFGIYGSEVEVFADSAHTVDSGDKLIGEHIARFLKKDVLADLVKDKK